MSWSGGRKTCWKSGAGHKRRAVRTHSPSPKHRTAGRTKAAPASLALPLRSVRQRRTRPAGGLKQALYKGLLPAALSPHGHTWHPHRLPRRPQTGDSRSAERLQLWKASCQRSASPVGTAAGKADGFRSQQKSPEDPVIFGAFRVGICLFSRAASSQVFSAQVGLTAVFGMGTGVPPPPSTPT